MPNRILKESICTSENIEQLSPFAEIAFYRLLVNCDDYGRMDARTKILKSRLFPLKDSQECDLEKWLKELEDADLITIYQVNGKPYLQMRTWELHQQVRAKRSKYPSANDSTCNQMISNDIKCPRNPIQSESLSESLSESESNALMDADDAHQIQIDQDRVLDAAEDAGFSMSNNVRASLIALYADHGLEKVLSGLRSCSEHGVTTLAYLRACMKDEQRKTVPIKAAVQAQNYSQRSYDGEQEDALRRMIRTVSG